MRPGVLLRIAGVETRKRMSYRADFWINACVGFLAEFGVIWFLWRALYWSRGVSAIEGYTLQGMILYQVAVILIGKVVRGPEFEGAVSQDIYDGALSRYLLYPVDYAACKYAQNLGSLLPMLLQMALFGALFPLALGVPEGMRITGSSVAACGICPQRRNVSR
jgi:ABC-2 type transport system permease protein